MNTQKKRIIYSVLASFIVIFSSTYAILMTLESRDYRNVLHSEYNKSMYQLINSVENIGNNLSKTPIAGSREQGIVVLGDIFRNSSIANDKIHSLPIPQAQIDGTSKFLTQLGDFCYMLEDKASKGQNISNDDITKVDQLKEAAFSLENQLKDVQNDINNGRVRWGEIRQKVGGVLAKSSLNMANNEFEIIQKQLAQYPTLVYDGPFSDNSLNISPKINALPKATKAQAEQMAVAAIGKGRVESIEQKSSEENPTIPTYKFYAKIKGRTSGDPVTCEVSRAGGKLLYLLDERTVGKPTMDLKKAISIGTNYLDSIGYKGMSSTYGLVYNNVAIISYVYSDKGVVVYPDQLKLKIALDDGSIMGIEAAKYLTAHVDNRNIGSPKVSQQQAKQRVSNRLQISTSRLALVPTETNKEVLCYEFAGSYKQDNFIVYINADTGYEQKILQIRNTPNGQLTM
ncbi:MAG: germination protein YpeB [Bacillota bacterium]|nr:germination protein YpeB [Bacillota bacterium]